MRIDVEEITDVKEVSSGEIKFLIEEPRRIVTLHPMEVEPVEPIPVPEPQPIDILFEASSNEITEGDTVTLTWSVQNADTITLNGNEVEASGSTEVSPTETMDYVLSASNEQYSDSETISVVVNPVILPVSLTFESSATEINEGESLTLTWTTENADTVTLNGSPVEANDSLEVTPEQSQNYTLTASNSDYEDSSTISIVVNAVVPEPTYQAETEAYMTAIAMPENEQWQYVDNFIVNMKNAGVWQKMKAIYPMIGGTDETHKINLKDPRDLDEAFRIIWYGSGVHSATGWKGNGSNAFGDTMLVQSEHLALDSGSFGFYVQANEESSFYRDMGIANRSGLMSNYGGNQYSRSMNGNFATISNSNGAGGFHSLSRTSMESYLAQKDDVITEIQSTASDIEDQSYAIGAEKASGTNAQFFSPREFSYAFIGYGLTQEEMLLHRQAVLQLQTDLGRAV